MHPVTTVIVFALIAALLWLQYAVGGWPPLVGSLIGCAIAVPLILGLHWLERKLSRR